MEVIKIRPQGFCKGVINAIKSLNDVLPDVKNDVYMLGGLVHNEHIINAYKEKGIVQINDYSNINDGTIIITAHGLSNKRRNEIINKGLNIIDTTCVEVKKIQDIISKKEKDNYSIIYYGAKNHPECKAILEDHLDIYLIESINDIYRLNISNDKIFFASQTTASYNDCLVIEDLLKKKYPNIEMIKDICNATKMRQLALIEKSKSCDFILVIGDKKSNNTNQLVNIAKTYTKASLIENISDLKDLDLSNVKRLGITAGASTPNILVDEIIKTIKDPNYVSLITNNDYIKF